VNTEGKAISRRFGGWQRERKPADIGLRRHSGNGSGCVFDRRHGHVTRRGLRLSDTVVPANLTSMRRPATIGGAGSSSTR
jgi:hypothetical protein